MPTIIAHLVGQTLLFAVVMSFCFAATPIAGRLRNLDLSYGLYVYHMPIVNGLLAAGLAGAYGVTIAIVVAIAVALFSWVFVEEPMLNRPRLERPALNRAFVRITDAGGRNSN